MILSEFPCTQCGLCCQNVSFSEHTIYLDRGDGTCRHYSDVDKHCLIYDTRPDICRVDKQYHINYSSLYSWDEFVELNIGVCRLLQGESDLGETDTVNVIKVSTY